MPEGIWDIFNLGYVTAYDWFLETSFQPIDVGFRQPSPAGKVAREAWRMRRASYRRQYVEGLQYNILLIEDG